MNFRQVHLDFHTSEKIGSIGSEFSKENFQQALKIGHVNSITLFSKCHHGWSYHPSKVNKMHPNLKFDLLKAQIEAAHEIGVKTPIYLSAGHDEKDAVEHSEWVAVEDNNRLRPFNEPGYHLMCFNSPYLDRLLLQIKEVCENYDADGIFLDIAGVRRCYCQYCRRTLINEGKDPFDIKNATELAERVYANYTKRVRDTIDSVKPGLAVFHNGGHIRRGRRDLAFMNTHLELESLPTGVYGYDHFPLSARYVQNLGVEFLGMTGKFHSSWGEFGGFKHKNALRYESALNAAHGAKMSVGDQLHPSGKMDMATYKTIGASYEEIERKEAWLDNVSAVSDIALLSNEAVENVYGTSHGTLKTAASEAGAVRILTEGKYLFDVVDLKQDISKYKVVILADDIDIPDFYKSVLDEFVKNGGKILASGTSAVKDVKFIYDLGAEYCGECEFNPSYFKTDTDIGKLFCSSYVMYSTAQVVKCTGEELAWLEAPYFNRTYEHFCSHKHAPNSGKILGNGITLGKDGAYIAWKVFSEYAEQGSLILKEIVRYTLDVLLSDRKTLETNLGAQGIVTLMKQESGNRYINHLLYVSPVKRGRGVEIIEDITPVYNISVTLRVKEKIKKVYLAPEMKEISFEQEGERVSYTVDKIECHQMVVSDY